MLNESQLEKLQEIFQTLFNMPDLEIGDSLTAKDVSGWDSFNHINLVVNIEEEFEIRFTNEEVSALQNVGDLKKLLASKISE